MKGRIFTNFVLGFFGIALLFAVFGFSDFVETSTYADCGVILDEPDGEVCVTLQNGHVFSFRDVDFDWNVGDLVTVVFDNSGTPEVIDDVIVNYRYSGWISSAELKHWIK